MGTSTNAMLVYGYIWDEEVDLFEDDEADWEEQLAVAAGAVNPWAQFPKEIDSLPYDQRKAQGDAWREAHRAELDAWYEAKRAAADSYGVTIDHHGSSEWSVPIVSIDKAGLTAFRGSPLPVTADNLTIGADWDDKLARFVADLGIDVSEAQGPGWFLASWWG
jgi:hypothetical protein